MEEKEKTKKFGARVYQLKGGVILVKQTVKSGAGYTDDYVVDGQKERHVNPDDDAALAQAIRDALAGNLKLR